jgi:hypothetical protein
VPPSLFALGIFQRGSHAFAQASLHIDLPIYVLHVAGMTDTWSPCLVLLVKIESCELIVHADLALLSFGSLPPE